MADKPRHRDGYTSQETELVRACCLTVAVTLGAFLDDICIIGGLVPSLLIDAQRLDVTDPEANHPGTNDLDIGLSLAVLDEGRYSQLSARLRSEGFEPDRSPRGNLTVQRWRMQGLNVTVDFLMPPAPNQDPDRRVQNLEADFGALITPGLQLAFDERVQVQLDGVTLRGERAARTLPVCGPGAYTVLKALALGDRGEPKDAYDLVYVIRGAPRGPSAIAAQLRRHAPLPRHRSPGP